VGYGSGRFTARRWLVAAALVLVALIALPSLAIGHIERASYWPDPAPDTSVNPPAGGAVPAVRSLSSALDPSQPGDTRVVCQPDSMTRFETRLAAAQQNGYKLRPTQPRITVSQPQADALRSVNQQLFAACQYDSIQAAVNDSRNNDRVEVMPGVYTEPDSRAAPTQDPKCADLVETNDKGSTGALSYRYQATCPNDQNLIAVIGREPGANPPPQPPALDRHGIPDLGPCIRCNLQIQGTGVSPDDVVIDGGDPSLGDHSAPGPNPPQYAKDVGIRADRADGFVVDDLKVRHFNEHGIYVPETDGFHLDRVKMAYNSEYGLLTFVGDHTLIENCAAWGSGDSGLYPGAAADLGDAVPPDQRRYGTELRDCDSFHNALGYSGTDGNAVWIHDNNFYGNTQGWSTDVFTAPGHPGFPQDSDLIEKNDFYSNNFNSYLPRCAAGQKPGPMGPNQGCSDFTPTVPVPVGNGMWIAGGNHNIVRDNRFWNNWRRGIMLYAVPDQLVCGPGVGSVDPSQLAGCDILKIPPSTSYNNEFTHNSMGVAPNGNKKRNGLDFWWDGFLGNTGNCWHDNTGPNGDRASLTSNPAKFPVAGLSIPLFLPENCKSSLGTVSLNEVEMLTCFADISFDIHLCNWFKTPPKPKP
jgi:hypothetical protein